MFLVAVLVPLVLIPVFPHSQILRAIDTSGIVFVLFVVTAAVASALFTSIFFRDKR